MPLYDRRCESCAWQKIDCYEPITPPAVPCPECGAATDRVWLMGSRATFHVIGDEWPGGKTFENLGHEPVTVYSRTELKREMDARGLQSFVRHQPPPDSDKSKHTQRWI